MNRNQVFYRQFVIILIATIAAIFYPQTTFGQAEKLGVVSYQAPTDFNKTASENVIAFSKIDRATGRFCIITLYGATPGTGRADTDFKREWKNLVLAKMQGEANPKTESEIDPRWTATAGGSPVTFEGSSAFALLTVVTRGTTTVSILGVFNDQDYLPQLAAFSDSISLDKAAASASPPTVSVPAAPASSATLAMHAAALVKEFELNELRANQTYIGKRVRIHGTINNIEINRAGQVVLTFKSSVSTYNNARCYFNKADSSRVATLSANAEGTVEGTVKGLGDGFGGTKSFLVLTDCVVP